jgi:hypothetical protein
MLTTISIDAATADGEPMKPPSDLPVPLDKDGLRLLGLSRVPRCAACARLDALLVAHRTGTRLATPWPAPPKGCREQICAPLIRRLAPVTATRHDLLALGDRPV